MWRVIFCAASTNQLIFDCCVRRILSPSNDPPSLPVTRVFIVARPDLNVEYVSSSNARPMNVNSGKVFYIFGALSTRYAFAHCTLRETGERQNAPKDE